MNYILGKRKGEWGDENKMCKHRFCNQCVYVCEKTTEKFQEIFLRS